MPRVSRRGGAEDTAALAVARHQRACHWRATGAYCVHDIVLTTQCHSQPTHADARGSHVMSQALRSRPTVTPEHVLLAEAVLTTLIASAALGLLLGGVDPGPRLRFTILLLALTLLGMTLAACWLSRRQARQVDSALRRHALTARISERALQAPGVESLLEEAAMLVGEVLGAECHAVVRAGGVSFSTDGDRILSAEDTWQLDIVARVVDLAIERHRMNELERAKLAELTRLAFHDALTGLPNRILFADRLDHALARAQREQSPVALLSLDLDDFKHINDTFGHAAGDEVLINVARRISSCLRQEDTAARLGGDEFAILLEHASDDDAARIAARIADALRAPVMFERHTLAISASIGIASASPGHALGTADVLVRGADSAMYAAKRRRAHA